MYAMIDHLKYYALRIQEMRMEGQKIDWLAREFCRDYGSQLTHKELRDWGLIIPFVTYADFGKEMTDDIN